MIANRRCPLNDGASPIAVKLLVEPSIGLKRFDHGKLVPEITTGSVQKRLEPDTNEFV